MGSRCFTHYFIFSITYYTAELSSFMVGLQGSTVACFRCSCDVCPALSSVFRKLPLVTCIFTVCLYTEIHLASQFSGIVSRLFRNLYRFCRLLFNFYCLRICQNKHSILKYSRSCHHTSKQKS